jgi:hypothetical protein
MFVDPMGHKALLEVGSTKMPGPPPKTSTVVGGPDHVSDVLGLQEKRAQGAS